MVVGDEDRDTVSEVFRVLGLDTDEKRRRFRLLGTLGRVDLRPEQEFQELAQTKNNTWRDEDYAGLERTS
jgi:hypothetical protein